MRPSVPLAVLPSEPERASRAAAAEAPSHGLRRLIDSHGRTIRDLRLSITDRCNFRCVYCMDPDVRFASPASLLTPSELHRVTQACVALGVERVRITGGEPTVHPELTEIIRRVASIAGVHDVSMTTNGSLVTRRSLTEWIGAGLRRITFSLDATTPETVRRMTRAQGDASQVIAAIQAAIDAGLQPVKVNAVVIRGMNEGEVPHLTALARTMGFEMRFIEYMPLDSGHRWDPSLLVPAAEILELASAAGALVPCDRADEHSTSERYRFRDVTGTHPHAGVGIIAPVTRPFCGACSRLRITADGTIRPCLFSLEEFDLMSIVRDATLADEGVRQRRIEDALIAAVWTKQRGHGIAAPDFRQPDRPMSAIGG